VNGQDSLITVNINDLRKSAILIIEGDECKEVLSLKVAQIVEKDTQIKELESIRNLQDSIIFNTNSIVSNKDLIIDNKDEIIEAKNKEIKKQKRKSVFIIIGSVVFIVLAAMI
jgi:hypothetical protein